jgi:hypothetical protein
MPERILFPEWRAQNSTTKYPFSDRATLTNARGTVLVEGCILDCALYPVGAGVGLFISNVAVDHQQVVLSVADATRRVVATGTMPLVNPPDDVALTDAYGRPAGLLVSESARLGIFQSWGVGDHAFTPDATEFAATVCFPTPDAGVSGFLLPDGSFLSGDVWLIGSDGVVLGLEDVPVPARCAGPAHVIRAVRLDVVGDPLFRRRLCTPTALFVTPRLVRRLRVLGPNQEFTVTPDAAGNVLFTGNNALAADSVLRLNNSAGGLVLSAVGSTDEAGTTI